MDKINLIDLDSFVFDLDNTLVFDKENISLKTIEIIEALLKNNKKVIIATGRPHFLAERIYKLLNLKTPIISINGAHIYNMENKTSIFTKTIDKDISKKVFTILTNYNMHFLIYEKQILNFYQAHQTQSNWINWLTKENDKLDIDQKFTINKIDKTFNFDNKKIIKFLVLLDESPIQNICKIKKQLTELSKYIYFLNSQSNALDIMPNNISKGYGLEILANNKIINLDKTICFGDANNDISMFEVCKYKVAMGNANQEVKEKANFVTDSTKEDGIYNFFKKYIKW